MATEVLVNDGGAPCRIIPIACSEAVTAGDVLELHTDGKVRPSVNDVEPAFGIALTAQATTGGLVNCITGSGVVVRVIQQTNLAAGQLVMVDGSNKGEVIAHTGTAAATKFPIGMTLEDVAAGAYVKILKF